jgi:hypothetical protein
MSMDTSTVATIVLGLFFGGIATVFGGYSLQQSHHFLAILSYVVGGGFVAASAVLTFVLPHMRSDTAEQLREITLLPGSQQPPSKQPRDFLPFTPAQLLAMVEGRTMVNAEKIVAPYRGKWISVSGPVSNVWENASGHTVSLCGPNPNRPDWTIWVYLEFDKAWDGPCSALAKQDQIEAIGQIRTFGGIDVTLEHCEITNFGGRSKDD